MMQATKNKNKAAAIMEKLSSNIAHELNQPLSIVGMAAETILLDMEENAGDKERHKHKLSTIIKQVERMGQIINHMRLPFEKPGKKKHILVVEDEIEAADNIAEYLRRKGFEIVIAKNGKNALALLASQSFDVVITDLCMPVMDGEKLLKKISMKKPSLPVIVMTGYMAMDNEQKILACGASAILRKPIKLRTLSSALTTQIISA